MSIGVIGVVGGIVECCLLESSGVSDVVNVLTHLNVFDVCDSVCASYDVGVSDDAAVFDTPNT